MGLIKRRLILFRVFIKTHYKENFFEPHLDLRRSAAPDSMHRSIFAHGKLETSIDILMVNSFMH